MMPRKIVQKSLPYLLVLMSLALSAGSVFAQDEPATSSASGLATLVLLLGLAAIFSVFFITWSQSQDDDESS